MREEIENAIYNAATSWLTAKDFLKNFDDNPAKAMVDVDEAINKLLEAHGFLRDAVMIQKRLNMQEAA